MGKKDQEPTGQGGVEPRRDMTGLMTALYLRTNWGTAEKRTPEKIQSDHELAQTLINANRQRNGLPPIEDEQEKS